MCLAVGGSWHSSAFAAERRQSSTSVALYYLLLKTKTPTETTVEEEIAANYRETQSTNITFEALENHLYRL